MQATERPIRLVADQAEAVLALVGKRVKRETIDGAEWSRLFESQGQRHLARREEEMQTPLSEDEFRRFVLSDELARQRVGLAKAMEAYKAVDLDVIIRRTTAYLPSDAAIGGTIYPVIKPKPNSFVFELETDPALFLAVTPDKTRPQLENTLVHELHHWGLASCCPEPAVRQRLDAASRPVQFAYEALTAFGEGLAMLAAAGGPNVHPHAVSNREDRERWDRELQSVDRDIKRLESFFLRILDGECATEQELFQAAMEFFDVQGPWYTVGWTMAQAVETVRGRNVLIDCMYDLRRLLVAYNEVVAERARGAETTAVWSDALIDRLVLTASGSQSETS